MREATRILIMSGYCPTAQQNTPLAGIGLQASGWKNAGKARCAGPLPPRPAPSGNVWGL